MPVPPRPRSPTPASRPAPARNNFRPVRISTSSEAIIGHRASDKRRNGSKSAQPQLCRRTSHRIVDHRLPQPSRPPHSPRKLDPPSGSLRRIRLPAWRKQKAPPRHRHEGALSISTSTTRTYSQLKLSSREPATAPARYRRARSTVPSPPAPQPRAPARPLPGPLPAARSSARATPTHGARPRSHAA
jgi:hypothetical protein